MRKLHFITLSLISISILLSCQSELTTKEDDIAKLTQKSRKHPAAIENKSSNVHTNVDGRKNRIVTAHLDVGGMNWITMDQASALENIEGKKFLVDVYTDWCGWCKVMDKKTFDNIDVKNYLQDNYHLVKFNAEQTDPIQFKGKKYEWMEVGRNGINSLAMEILGNQLSYPTLVYFDKNLNKINASPGYKGPEQLLAELKGMDN